MRVIDRHRRPCLSALYSEVGDGCSRRALNYQPCRARAIRQVDGVIDFNELTDSLPIWATMQLGQAFYTNLVHDAIDDLAVVAIQRQRREALHLTRRRRRRLSGQIARVERPRLAAKSQTSRFPNAPIAVVSAPDSGGTSAAF